MAQAVIEELLARGARLVATTHASPLKLLALRDTRLQVGCGTSSVPASSPAQRTTASVPHTHRRARACTHTHTHGSGTPRSVVV